MKLLPWFTMVIILLPACATRGFPTISDSSKHIDIVSGVSVLPPQEADWKILSMSSIQLALGKQDRIPGETYAAVTSVYNFPKIDTEEEYFKKISESRNSAPQTGRFAILKNEEHLLSGKGTYCVQYHSTSEDKGARVGTEKKTMILETIGRHCQHPKNKLIGVNLEYSHRHFSGNEDPAIETKANAFLEQVKFTDF